MPSSVLPSQPTLIPVLPSTQSYIYHAIANASSDAMLIAESLHAEAGELSITYVNEPFSRLTGYRSDELVGQPLTFLHTCTAPASSLELLWQGIAQQRAINQTWRCRAKEGLVRMAELSLVPLANGNGGSQFLLIFRTVTSTDAVQLLDEAGIASIQNLIDCSQLGIIVFAPSTVVVAASKYARGRIKELFSYDLEIGRPAPKQILAMLGDSFAQDFESTLQGNTVQGEVMAVTSSGKSMWYDINYSPLRDESGSVRFVVLVAWNNTKLKQTEDKLATSLRRYHLAIANAKASVWELNIETGEVYVEPPGITLFGDGSEGFKSDLAHWVELIHPDDREEVLAALQTHISGETDELRAECRLLQRDGTFAWLLTTARVSRDQNGRAVRLLGTSLNIDERKEIEAALRASEARFRALWEASPDAMVLSDAEANVILANQAYFELYGYPAGDMLGKPFYIIFPQEYRAAALQEYLTYFEAGVLPKNVIAQVQSANGQHKTVEVSAQFVRQENQPVALFSAIRDVTERIAIDDALKRHMRQSEALMRCSQLFLKPYPDATAQRNCLHATLDVLREGLQAEYLAICHLDESGNQIATAFCIEVIAPELAGAASDGTSLPVRTQMHLSENLLQLLSKNTRMAASSHEVTTGVLTGRFKSFHLEPLPTSEKMWGFLTLGTRASGQEWKSEELQFLQTAAEMIGNVIQRWEAEGAVRLGQATLEQQVQQRSEMLFQTVESLQHQIGERRRAETEVRRRLDIERTLGTISSRLMTETNFDDAVTATLADIGDKLMADQIVLLRLHPVADTFSVSHRWSNERHARRSPKRNLAVREIPHLLNHLRQHGYFLYHGAISAYGSEAVERTALQSWYEESILVLLLYASDKIAGLLLICDGEPLLDNGEEGLHFVRAAAGMLNGMLRIDQVMNALEERIAEQTEELAAFFDMAVLASGSERLTETLAAALSLVKEIGNCDAVCVHILSPDGAALQLAYQVGMEKIEHRHLLRLTQGSTLYQRIHHLNTPILVTESELSVLDIHLEGFQTYFGSPMVARGNVQGLLSCYWRFANSVSLNQMSLLTALTDQLGIILENQRLHRHAQEVGVVHERQRLARELHDSVTQAMYSVMLFARAAREAVEDNDQARLSDCLAQVEGASLRSLKEMRLLLYQLRPMALESQGVAEAIRSRVELVERRLGIEVDMQMTPIVGISRAVEEALYYVTMEALNNVLKHADADRVAIQLFLAGGKAELCVRDDGVGFHLEEVRQGMGLDNMRERINALGGDFRIRTAINDGTDILVQIPIE